MYTILAAHSNRYGLFCSLAVEATGAVSSSIAALSFRGAAYSGVFTLMPLLTGKAREQHGLYGRSIPCLTQRTTKGKPGGDNVRHSKATVSLPAFCGGDTGKELKRQQDRQ